MKVKQIKKHHIVLMKRHAFKRMCEHRIAANKRRRELVKNLYVCDGYWYDTKEPFFGMVVSTGTWDGLEDAKDERIFYYTDGAPIGGDHGEFVITSAEEMK